MNLDDITEIYFLPVTETDAVSIAELKIEKEQESFIESTSQCLKEAGELSLWRPVGIYRGDTLIGFAMYGLWREEGINGRVWLDRFLIDRRYQGCGYGKAALNLLIERITREYECREVYLSLYADNSAAIYLYEKTGFCFNGEIDEHGEKVMVLKY